jgi:glyoxylase-like metal-dependent hydrolase (beta-lactamase superfamily II)
MPNGGQTTLGFHPTTHLLHALIGVSPNFPGGDQAVETELLDYRMLNGVLLPTEWVTRRAGVIVSRYRYTSATPSYQIPDSLLTPPAGFTPVTPPPAADPVRSLGTGLWAVQSSGYWSIVVEFQDHVLVVDASSGGASGLLSRVATLVPNKPVGWVVPTHHHSDHFGGLRSFAAAGATTVTTPGNVDLFRRLMSAPISTLTPTATVLPRGAMPRVEAITGKRRVFTDGTRTVEIHDVGPTPHADEILVAWLPSEGVLFHADLIEAADGVALPGSSSPTTVRLAEYIRAQGWNVRVFAGAHGFLSDPSQFETLVRSPVIPPN